MVIGKFRVSSVAPANYGGSDVSLWAIYDDKLPEDRKFAEATPNGMIKMVVNNVKAEDQFKQLNQSENKVVFVLFMSEDEYRLSLQVEAEKANPNPV